MTASPRDAGCSAVTEMSGGQGTGRSALLVSAVQAASRGTFAGRDRAVVLVDPLDAFRPGDLGVDGFDPQILRGDVARSSGVFDVLMVMARVSPGLVIGIDDAEHLPDHRRHWVSLVSTVVSSGGRLLLMLPDLGVFTPNDPRDVAHIRFKGPVVARPPVLFHPASRAAALARAMPLH